MRIYLMISYCIVFFFLMSGISKADENTPVSQKISKPQVELNKFCKIKVDILNPKHFKDAYLEAIEIRENFCNPLNAESRNAQKYVINFYKHLNEVISLEDIDRIQKSEINELDKGPGLTAFNYDFSEDKTRMNIVYVDISRDSISKCEQKAKSISSTMECSDLMDEFNGIFEIVFGPVAIRDVIDHYLYTTNLGQEWDDFIELSKPQTIWERYVNGRIFSNKNSDDGFLPPPEKQLIFLHPGLAFENIGAAIDGDEVKESFSLDIIGVNWWKRDKWYAPSGISLTAIYSDRADIDDLGYGFSLHFKSKFFIGVSRHGSENGVFASFDLIELFKGKLKIKESYKAFF